MKYIGIIPARYASTRFPGKPLAEIGGKTVIRRVYEQASKALDIILVATDDDRIYDAVEAFGGKVVMTRADHRCGTDRCLEAYDAITTPSWRAQNDTDTVVINIQGDEPWISIVIATTTPIAWISSAMRSTRFVSLISKTSSPKHVSRKPKWSLLPYLPKSKQT